MVLSGKIAEADYDENVLEAIRITCQIICTVEDDVHHAALSEAALILRQRGPSVTKKLEELLKRLKKDESTGQVKLLDKAQIAESDDEPIGYAPALELASKIAKEGNCSVLAAALERTAASTQDSDEARSLATAAARIKECLVNNRDEHGQRRFSDAQLSAWMNPERPSKIITRDSMLAEYAASRTETRELERKLNEAGIIPPAPASPQPISRNPAVEIKAEPISEPKWRVAEQQVYKFLRKTSWQVEDVTQQKMGFDFVVHTPEGNDTFIDVKSIEEAGDPFTMTPQEMAVAGQKGLSYQLALVRQTNLGLEMAFIVDPAKRLKFTEQCRQWEWHCADYQFNPQRYPLE